MARQFESFHHIAWYVLQFVMHLAMVPPLTNAIKRTLGQAGLNGGLG